MHRNNVYRVVVQCRYLSGTLFKEEFTIAAKNAESAMRKARVEAARLARPWKDDRKMAFTVVDFLSVDKIAENLIA